MVCLLPSAGRLVREAGMLRRRYCSGPLVLLGVAVCLFYQTLMVARNRLRSNQPAADVRNKKPFDELLLADTGRFISALETLQREREVQESAQKAAGRRRAVVLTGRHTVTDTEVQLYQRVLEQVGHEVQLSRYAETSGVLRPSRGSIEWSILVCLSGSEKSCLRRVSFSHLQPHQRVNMVPWLVQAFSDAGGGLCQFYKNTRLSGFALPMKPYACGSTNEKLRVLQDSTRHERDPDRYSASPPKPPGLIAMVNVYVLVTSASPLTAFLHERCVVRTNEELSGQTTQLKTFLLQRLGPTASHKALGQLKEVIGQVLRAAVLTNQEVNSLHRCLLCYQLLTFTLHFTGSLTPVVIKLDTDLRFAGLRDPAFDGQITKELILEDTLRFLLPPHSGLPGLTMTSHVQRDRTEKYGGCKGTHGLCLPEDELLLLLQFHRQMKTPGAFELLFPSASLEDQPVQQLLSQSVTTANSAASVFHLPALLLRLSLYHQLQRNHTFRTDEAETQSNQESVLASQDLLEGRERCVDPHLRQIYTDPPLTLTPTFSPWVKEYHAEVPFDVVTVRIRPEPVSSACLIHLDEHRGPRTANYPVGLGNSRISILVADETVPEPVVMTIYTLHMYRESRPSLPMFGDHVMCGFVQDCGLIVQPGQPCGLQPFPGPKTSSTVTPQPCTSGDVPGQWVVPCLSCADNRTCDWREVAWQPEGCYHPVLDHPQLQDCMTDRKVLFIGDSTNRGMMYFLMERVNTSLEDWGKAHDTLIYSNLNQGRTHVSYSYYPQFWLEKSLRPTFQQALEQLIHRSRPLVNSNQTVLVAGGVQWLNTNHLRVIKEVLEREGLSNILVVVKSLGMGFHLPVDGIRSLSLRGIQELYRENHKVIATAKQYGYEVIDTFCITMGRYKEFLQGRCACHFHEVEKLWFSKAPLHRKMKILQHNADDTTSGSSRGRVTGTGPGPGLSSQSVLQDADQWTASNASSYHVRGPVNQVYSEILLSRLCPKNRGN
ncbi:cadherin-like and PC-esterase domain-containing protein 1 isoform X2 [Myripristis murdjan]|uniref:cadherin-like and PC-esterase domain-containing protein 1 isoform X2 n=1 Tax=Myripristis murdjan TaxID=586833 RepID=UPI0011762DE8|nr:cadherin-like and PC-esterase domain-containing protein 1 isoform X2 [Myripristis murdjan]